MSFDRNALSAAIATHGPITRVVIARLTGSSPREVGTAMLVWADGQSGTIGGGALEFEATHRARDGLVGAHDYPLGPTLGQCCGGHVTLVYERFEKTPDLPADQNAYIRRIQGDAAPPPLQGNQTEYKNGWLSEPMGHTDIPLWLWGAGHVGRAVAEVIHDIPGFHITWADTGTDRFPDHLPQTITPIPSPSLPNLMAHAPQDAIHLIFTYSHDIDLELCHRALQRGFRFCGLIGSDTKWARFRSRLHALGHRKDEINRIICPIGLPELGKHPKMIALGVAQRLVSDLNAMGDIWGDTAAVDT